MTTSTIVSPLTSLPTWVLDHIEERQNVRLVTPMELATALLAIQGHSFASIVEKFDMLEMDNKGKPKRMKIRGNPFLEEPQLSAGLFKLAKSQYTVNFDYEKKRESRGGDEPETHGSWHTALLFANKLTPLAIHKADCGVKDSTLPIMQQQAVLDDNGNTVIAVDNPRLYLRYEIVRDTGETGDESRQDRKMRREKKYITTAGVIIPDESVEPWLPARPERTDETDFQLTCLANIAALTIGGMTYMVRKSA